MDLATGPNMEKGPASDVQLHGLNCAKDNHYFERASMKWDPPCMQNNDYYLYSHGQR